VPLLFKLLARAHVARVEALAVGAVDGRRGRGPVPRVGRNAQIRLSQSLLDLLNLNVACRTQTKEEEEEEKKTKNKQKW
jgi:hypothetical protein